jgi:hypothetical protein
MASLRRTGPTELAGEIALQGIPKPLELIFETTQPQPSTLQSDALAAHVDAWGVQRGAIERALYAYYRDTALGATESGPVITSAPGVWQHVTLDRLRVLSVQQAGLAVTQVTGGCSWEEEHGLELDFLGGTNMVYVGQCDGRGYLPPSVEQSWNYASADVQEAAFESREVEMPEPMEEAVIQAKMQPAAEKPWWKLW